VAVAQAEWLGLHCKVIGSNRAGQA
jgi:hypothetical protein